MSKALRNEDFTELERTELHSLGEALEIQESTLKQGKRTLACYYVCRVNKFHCNPDNPPPNCDCIYVCI